jgi:hypothetical protein
MAGFCAKQLLAIASAERVVDNDFFIPLLLWLFLERKDAETQR